MKWSALVVASAVLFGCRESGPSPADTAPPIAIATSASAGAASTTPATTALSPASTAPPGSWSFDADKTNAPPAGFSFGLTGGGKEGHWEVIAAPVAPSGPNVLAQLDADPTDSRFPVAVVDASSFKDVKLAVSCKPISGRVDQGCGLVWRYRDANNYYLTRANALEDNVRLYCVKAGRRNQLASWSGKVASSVWHRLRVHARGDQVEVYFDEKKVIDAKDSTFGDAGKVGVWTKADSVIQFDELEAKAFSP